MEIKGPNLNYYPSKHSRSSLEANQLQNGQILKAVVANINNNTVLLELIEPKLSMKFEAIGNPGFKPGQIITLQVANSGPPISLSVIDSNDIKGKSQNIINAALKLVIPKQSSMNQLLSNLQYLSKANPTLNKTYPKEILDLSRTIYQDLPSLKDIRTAAGIKIALNSSGIFLEQQILTTILNKTNFTINDTRTSLLRLAESIRSNITDLLRTNTKSTLFSEKAFTPPSFNNSHQLPKNQYSSQNIQHFNASNNNFNVADMKRIPSNLTSMQHTNAALNELLHNIESSLAKIQYNQLQHFIPDDQSKTNWLFDLPIKHKDGSDIFHFKFTKEDDSDNNTKNDDWSVTLTFNLENLGDVSIQIYLRNDKIGATVWANKNETVDLFNQYLSSLQQQMERSGINISNIRCHKGALQQPEFNIKQNLLDEKT
ncbi:MAG: flagellar hook-length control protein FliK [Thiohalomonadales bacterium]